jgi:hypothetical protein
LKNVLRLDLTTIPGGVRVNWRTGEGLTFHRRDGSLIMKINADYADDRALMTAAHALNFMFRTGKHANTDSTHTTDRATDTGDGGQA